MAKLTLSVDGVLGELSNFDEKDARCLATIAQILRSDEILEGDRKIHGTLPEKGY